MRVVRQLGREDWVEAGLRLLARGGATALRVEAAARELSVTKGSFYWHFQDRDDWCAAILGYWEHRAFGRMVARPGRRANAAELAGDMALDHAVRAWARRDVAAAQALGRVLREAARSGAMAPARAA
jgi:AcrR family transcriptional regulator